MDWNLLLTAGGLTVTIGGIWLSPLNKARRRRKAADEILLGCAAIRDRSGQLMRPAVPGIVARLDAQDEKLRAPLLNGAGHDLIETVRRLEERQRRLERGVTAIKKQLSL